MDKQILNQARDLLLTPTPLHQDCGILCGQACCKPDDDGRGGMLLFPGENALYENVEWAGLERCSDSPDDFLLKCNGRCARSMRPLACRIFPLSPYFNEAGALDLRLDQRAWAMCPLMEYGLQGISRAFYQSVLEALQLINSDPDGHEFLLRWQREEDLYRIGPL